MVAGAPRTVCPEYEELILLGKELVAWAVSKDTKDSQKLHLKQWYNLEKHFTKNTWDTMCHKPEFIPYYEEAKAAISIRYLNGVVNPSIAHRFMRHYFDELVDDDKCIALQELDIKKQLIEWEAKLKSSGNVVDEAVLEQFNALMGQLSALQEARKMADKSKRAESKS